MANLLFNNAKKWLQNENIEAMDGPINFGERNKYWGLFTEGFKHSPVYGNNYNPKSTNIKTNHKTNKYKINKYKINYKINKYKINKYKSNK